MGLRGRLVGLGTSHGAVTAGTGLGSSSANSHLTSAVARNGVDAAVVYAQVRPSLVTVATTVLQRRSRAQGEGSGVVLDTARRILTNNHVVDGASSINVTFAGGHSYPVTVVVQDAPNDLAGLLVKAPAALVHPATLGDATRLHVGDSVLALGNPLGYEASLSEGIVSGLDRTFNEGQGTVMRHLIQSDAAINSGNSGGPLLDAAGSVVGINTLLDNANNTDSFTDMGFAVSMNTARAPISRAGTD